MEFKENELRQKIMHALVTFRDEKGLSQEQLADYLQLAPSTVASWEQGKSLPKIHTLYHLSVYYGKTIAEMYGETTPVASDLRSDELELINKYRSLNDTGRQVLKNTAEGLIHNTNYVKNTGSSDARAG